MMAAPGTRCERVGCKAGVVTFLPTPTKPRSHRRAALRFPPFLPTPTNPPRP